MAYNRHKEVFEGWIYLITNKINNKRYIGQTTTTIQQRWKQHQSATIRKGTQLVDRQIKKYGKENFTIQEIQMISEPELYDLKERLNILEKQYIQKYNTMIPKYGGNGYNVDFGGQSNNVCGKPIDVYNMDGELVATYPSKVSVALKYGIADKQVYDVCHGIQKNYRCLCVFRYHGDAFDKFDVVSKYYKLIYQFNLDGDLVGKYYSYNEITNKYGIDFVYQVIDNPYRIAGGYWWSTSDTFGYCGEEKKPTRIVEEYDLWGNFLNKYPSIAICSEKTGFSTNAITNNCNGETATLGSSIFRYHGDSVNKFDDKFGDEILQTLLIHHYPVVQFDKNGEKIAIFDHIVEANRSIKHRHSPNDILNCCLHNRDSVENYIWRFTFDEYCPDDLLHEKRLRHANYRFDKIDVFSLDGIFIQTLSSIDACVNFFGKYDKSTLYTALSRNGYMYGYIVKKHGDQNSIVYDNWRVPVDKYTLNGELVGEYKTILDGAKSIKKDKKATSGIKQCLNGECTQAYGYVWRRHGESFQSGKLKKEYAHTPVNCYTLDNLFYQTFEYVKAAASFVNRSPDSISQCCKHRSKTCGGYRFFYVSDPTQPDPTKVIASQFITKPPPNERGGLSRVYNLSF